MEQITGRGRDSLFILVFGVGNRWRRQETTADKYQLDQLIPTSHLWADIAHLNSSQHEANKSGSLQAFLGHLFT